MRPKYRVAAWDYSNQEWVYVGKKGLTHGPKAAMIVRSSKRAHRLALKYSRPAQPLREALEFDVYVFYRD